MQHFTPHPYQQAAIDAIIDKPSVGLWMEMGLGKTVVTLTAIDTLIYDAAEIRRVLVVAPKKVAEATWQDEAQKWDHLQHLRISTVLGTEAQRIAALNTPADVYIINRENCYWLVGHYGRHWPFDMVVLDEASSFKNHAAQRFKALKAVRPKIAKVVELTGTPAPNNLLDLWAQIYLLDQGERLGKYVTHYRQAYFWPTEYSWEAKDGAGDAIRRKISDLVLSFKAADLLELPEKIVEDVPVVLDAKAAAAYKTMEKKCLLQVDGQKALVFYHFRFDEEQLVETLKHNHSGLRVAVLRDNRDAAAWNAGEIDVLLAQPASCAYGLNLQQGGHHLIWYSMPWSLELYAQGEARLYRQGQKQSVIVHRLIVKHGADELVVKALNSKDRNQNALMQALKSYIKERG